MMYLNLNSINLQSLITLEANAKFNANNKCCCPFHDEKTPSFSLYDNNKKFKCFGCGEQGDAIDFISKYKNLSFLEAIEYLNLEDQLSKKDKDKLEQKRIVIAEFKRVYEPKGFKIARVDEFQDRESNIYYKAKLKDEHNKSSNSFAILENQTVKFSLEGRTQLPYKYLELLKALEDKQNIFITEGEKDADTITNFLGAGFATSLKGLPFNGKGEALKPIFKGANVYFVGDTGEAGEKYKNDVWCFLKDEVASFNVVSILGIEKLGDNKDVTDWVDSFKSKDNIEHTDIKWLFKDFCNNSWDFKKSTIFPRMKLEEKTGEWRPIPNDYYNIQAFLKLKKLNVVRDEVTDVLNITAVNDMYVVKNEINTHLISSDMRASGLKAEPKVIQEIFELMKYEKYENFFQNLVKTNRNKNYQLIDDTVGLLRLETDREKNLFRKFLFNYVNQGFNSLSGSEPKFICQGMLVLQGGQGIGKSTFVEQLGLCDTEKVFYRSVEGLDLDDAHSMLAHTRRNIVELNEMLISTRKEYNAMKSFLTQGLDDFRPLYKNEKIQKPRFTVFVSTTNDTKFLKDPTGSRRFWIIHPRTNPETGFIDNPKTKGIDMKQILGAIYDILVDKTDEERIALCGLSKQEMEECNAVNSKHYDGGNIEAVFEELFDIHSTAPKEEFLTKSELFDLLARYEIKIKDDWKRVENYLKANGVEFCPDGYPKVYRINGKMHRGFKLWRRLAKDETKVSRSVDYEFKKSPEAIKQLIVETNNKNNDEINVQQEIQKLQYEASEYEGYQSFLVERIGRNVVENGEQKQEISITLRAQRKGDEEDVLYLKAMLLEEKSVCYLYPDTALGDAGFRIQIGSHMSNNVVREIKASEIDKIELKVIRHEIDGVNFVSPDDKRLDEYIVLLNKHLNKIF